MALPGFASGSGCSESLALSASAPSRGGATVTQPSPNAASDTTLSLVLKAPGRAGALRGGSFAGGPASEC